MKRLLQKISIASLLFIGLVSPLVVAQAVSAQTTPPPPSVTSPGGAKGKICEGLEGGCSGESSGINGVIELVVNILSAIVGIAAVIMIIVGGFKYVISSGDSSNINSAKNTILYAIIGLVIVAMAQVIVRFVLKKATD